jgi:hypothetical protein
MRNSYPVLLVSNAPLKELADLSWPAPAIHHSPEDRAHELAESRPWGGLIVVVDGSGPLRRSRDLIETYLRSQPMGNVAVLSATPCATMSTLFSYLPSRVDIFFVPWDMGAVRGFLKLEPAPAGASR